MELYTFDFEVTDRLAWPSNFGRVSLLANDYWDAFYTAHAMVYGLRGVEMVTELQLVL